MLAIFQGFKLLTLLLLTHSMKTKVTFSEMQMIALSHEIYQLLFCFVFWIFFPMSDCWMSAICRVCSTRSAPFMRRWAPAIAAILVKKSVGRLLVDYSDFSNILYMREHSRNQYLSNFFWDGAGLLFVFLRYYNMWLFLLMILGASVMVYSISVSDTDNALVHIVLSCFDSSCFDSANIVCVFSNLFLASS